MLLDAGWNTATLRFETFVVAHLKIGHYTRKEKTPAADGGRYKAGVPVASSAWLETREETTLYAHLGDS
jgi:hypothetical protein